MATDDFNRADGALGANWTGTGGSAPLISGNEAIGNDGDYSAAFYSGASFIDNHSSQITKSNGSSFQGPGVRMAAGAGHGTWYAYFNHGSVQVSTDGSEGTEIASRSTFADTNTAKLSITGTTLTPYVNGTPGSTITDASLSTGDPGIVFNGTAGQADDWEGLDVGGGGGGNVTAWIRA